MERRQSLEIPALAINHARHIGFTLESILLNGLAFVLPKKMQQHFPNADAQLAHARQSLLNLLNQDAQRIAQGFYPLSVLEPESLVTHLIRIPKLALDGLWMSFRRGRGKTQTFATDAEKLLDELPRYYRRNFHFQTDGYLSTRSAEIYEHQVEVLFAGAADAMRRLILAPMKKALHDKLHGNPTGRGLHFLELAAGTGRTTRFVRLAFPDAKITVTDLSDPYLQVARKKLRGFKGMNFVQTDAAKLPFQDETFDAVYSVFLFHELPQEERAKVIGEASRVLKSGGFHGIVDSIQKHDVPDLNPFLEMFPKNYHEPFYRNYSENPIEAVVQMAGLENIKTEVGFFSKQVSARKKI